MTKLKASDKFHKEENFNCAQAVLKFFEDHPSVTVQDIADYKAWGGGRAPEGVCGAIFATGKILNDQEKLNA
ncbi:MAG: hypothetical protein WC071_02585, partial [Victivallaceae bacterium]